MLELSFVKCSNQVSDSFGYPYDVQTYTQTILAQYKELLLALSGGEGDASQLRCRMPVSTICPESNKYKYVVHVFTNFHTNSLEPSNHTYRNTNAFGSFNITTFADLGAIATLAPFLVKNLWGAHTFLSGGS